MRRRPRDTVSDIIVRESVVQQMNTGVNLKGKMENGVCGCVLAGD